MTPKPFYALHVLPSKFLCVTCETSGQQTRQKWNGCSTESRSDSLGWVLHWVSLCQGITPRDGYRGGNCMNGRAASPGFVLPPKYNYKSWMCCKVFYCVTIQSRFVHTQCCQQKQWWLDLPIISSVFPPKEWMTKWQKQRLWSRLSRHFE
jgi:hypothetical protein